MELTEDIVVKCLNYLYKNQANHKIYIDYYEGKHKILSDYPIVDNRSNMRIVNNFPRKFVDNEVGYLLGKPINYISNSDSEEIIDEITKDFDGWEKEHNITLRKQSEIYGESYELDYVDAEGNFKAATLNPMNTYVLEDGTDERNVILALNIFNKPFDNTDYLDCYMANEIIHYQIGSNHADGSLVEIGRTSHIFGCVPVIVCPANYERISGISDIISLVDAYNQIQSDLVNQIADDRQAYLTITGAKLDEDGLKQMKAMGIVQVPEDGKISWLTKNINDSFVKNELESIRNEIYNFADEVDISQNWTSNTSSVAIQQKLLNLENRVAMREAFMEKAIKQRIRNLFTFIKIKQGKQYDEHDISIKFTRNVPTDLGSLADVISKLTGVCSQETLLSILPFVASPKTEVEKYNKQHANDNQNIPTDDTEFNNNNLNK